MSATYDGFPQQNILTGVIIASFFLFHLFLFCTLFLFYNFVSWFELKPRKFTTLNSDRETVLWCLN